MFGTGAGIALDFKDQGGFDDGDGAGFAGEDIGHPALLGGNDGGMDNGVEVLQAAFFKG